ncbi:hypothetical protein Sjap_022650 [Stephania japonica]|uniref:Uncharacterized protein n=1 Tax=Stephania japonica TaxID=461633 RepID=A0AAP0HQ26_9MAGN
MGRRDSKQSESKLIRCVKAPMRALCSARDMYVRSMTQCAGRTSHTAAMGMGAGAVSSIPRSFSASSSRRSGEDEDLRELIRAASQKGLLSKIELEIRQKQQQQQQRKSEALPRSFTVGIGRIDEEKASEFDEEEPVVKPRVLYPRSKTYGAASKRTTGLFA